VKKEIPGKWAGEEIYYFVWALKEDNVGIVVW